MKTILTLIISLLILSGCAVQNTVEDTPVVVDPGLKLEFASEKLLTYTDEEYGFSFQYPERYVVDGFYLWLESRYRWHMDNSHINDTRHAPDIQIITGRLDGEVLSEYVTNLYSIDDFENRKIGGRSFIEIEHTIVGITRIGFYTEQDGIVVGFVDLGYKAGDEKDLRDIAETIVFKR